MTSGVLRCSFIVQNLNKDFSSEILFLVIVAASVLCFLISLVLVTIYISNFKSKKDTGMPLSVTFTSILDLCGTFSSFQCTFHFWMGRPTR